MKSTIKNENVTNRAINDLEMDTLITTQLAYPKATIYLLLSKFGDWFAGSGLSAVLVLYLTRYLAYSPQDATVLYHGFNTVVFLMSIVGALIADGWLGKYKTVLYLYIAYIIGFAAIVFGSIPVLGMPSREFTITGLLLIALGTGGIKPCVVALGGDQFKLPEQAKEMSQFYSLIYFTMKLTNLTAFALIPVLRNDVKCFGKEYCFPIAFGVPGSFLVLAFIAIIMVSGSIRKYIPTDNVVILVFKCIFTGATLRNRNQNKDPEGHWLNYAIPKFGTQFVNNVKALLNIIVIFLPIPMFWALDEQTGSRWVLQATLLNGDIGFYNIKPDQINFLLPLMTMVFIPLLDFAIYPFLLRFGIKTDLKRLVLGTFLGSLSFIAAGVLENQTLDRIYSNSIHMLWMVPQFVLLAMAEAVVGVTGLRFAYKEAPENMKTLVQACWLLTISCGNLIVLVIVSVRFFDNEASLSFFFAALLFVNSLWFMWLAKRYKRCIRYA